MQMFTDPGVVLTLLCCVLHPTRASELPYSSSEYWDQHHSMSSEVFNWVWSDKDFAHFIPALLSASEPVSLGAVKLRMQEVVELGHGTSEVSALLSNRRDVVPQKPVAVTAVDYSKVAHKHMLERFPAGANPGLNFVHSDIVKFLHAREEGKTDFMFDSSTLDALRLGIPKAADVFEQVLKPIFSCMNPEHSTYVSASTYSKQNGPLKFFLHQPWDHLHLCKKKGNTDIVYVMMRGRRKPPASSPYFLAGKKYKCWDLTHKLKHRSDLYQ